MGEVTEMFDVKHSLIRYWEENFDMLRPRKNNKGNRLFTPQDIELLKLIYHLVREKKMTIAGANKYIKENRNSANRDVQILDHLSQIRSELMAIRQEITDREAENQIIVPNAKIEPEHPSQQDEKDTEKANTAPTPRFIEPTLFDF